MKPHWTDKDPQAQRLAAVTARLESADGGHVPLLHNPDGSLLLEQAAYVEVYGPTAWVWKKK